jgi:hypothetical protein
MKNIIFLSIFILGVIGCMEKRARLKVFNFANCSIVQREVDVSIAKVKFLLPDYIVIDTGKWEKRNICFRVFGSIDSTKFGFVSVDNNSNYKYAAKNIHHWLKTCEAGVDSNRILIVDTFYRSKNIEVGYANYYTSNLDGDFLEGHIVFIKDSFLYGNIFLRIPASDSTYLKKNFTDCIFRSFQSY